MCAVSIYSSGSTGLQQVRLLVRFSLRRLDSVRAILNENDNFEIP